MVEYSLSGSRCAVIGGVVYRGSSLPWLEGAYLYADYCSGELWGLRYDGEQVTEHTLLNDSVRRFPRLAKTRMARCTFYPSMAASTGWPRPNRGWATFQHSL